MLPTPFIRWDDVALIKSFSALAGCSPPQTPPTRFELTVDALATIRLDDRLVGPMIE